jgi:hypothetical protein
MPVKQAEISSWRRVERVGEVAVGGCRASGAVVLAIDVFVRVVGGEIWAVEAGVAFRRRPLASVKVEVSELH